MYKNGGFPLDFQVTWNDKVLFAVLFFTTLVLNDIVQPDPSKLIHILQPVQ